MKEHNKESRRRAKSKKAYIFAAAILALLQIFMIFSGCTTHNTIDESYALIRLHVRANSNSDDDQAVKMTVKGVVCDYLTHRLDGVNDVETAYLVISACLGDVEALCRQTLERNGFFYGASVRLNEEYFPTRAYYDLIVESGYYDALIIELGSGKGDNWWCVLYPPLCFVGADGMGDFRYKSRIAEILAQFFG